MYEQLYHINERFFNNLRGKSSGRGKSTKGWWYGAELSGTCNLC